MPKNWFLLILTFATIIGLITYNQTDNPNVYFTALISICAVVLGATTLTFLKQDLHNN
ncbi:Uncharacterised protein [Macrococcoides caseolyticum]|uniref:hypothetical protein n=1 Tax=Macrococcoides caseolyticum TaxID=69966 RepID=UPI00116FB560|nr:hypothetical protein [Macrococcus caseolyticus]VUC64607.1 Uncharacterised protein [Macrococcus caseolyticus]